MTMTRTASMWVVFAVAVGAVIAVEAVAQVLAIAADDAAALRAALTRRMRSD